MYISWVCWYQLMIKKNRECELESLSQMLNIYNISFNEFKMFFNLCIDDKFCNYTIILIYMLVNLAV